MKLSPGIVVRVGLFVLGVVAAACSGGDGASGGSRAGTGGGSAASGGAEAAAAGTAGTAVGAFGNSQVKTPTTRGTGTAAPVLAKADRADLLFVVDNSGSMVEEQAALRAQFPKLIEALTAGGNAGGDSEFLAIKDLHLGVVTSDLGLVGVQGVPGCGGLGDDAVLQTAPATVEAGCDASYPPFIEYTTGTDREQVAQAFSCLASVGTEGCGFEQQLEVALKALWPSIDIDPFNGEVIEPNRVNFLPDIISGLGGVGHGDTTNMGFLRNDAQTGRSLIAIVIVTDEEDCSSKDTVHFTPNEYLDGSDPLYSQDLNLRCHLNPKNLFLTERYVNGFKMLREGQENLVVFAAIAGVPPDLVDAAAMQGVDFADETSRNAYYQGLLDDPRMQEVVDPNLPKGEGNLKPSCNTASGVAYPPRRIVEVARNFGEFGVVQSICQDDFGPAMDAIIAQIGYSIGKN